MKVTLKNLNDGELREILPGDFPLAIGRGEQASLQIDDRWASRRHCELDLIGGRPVVRDLNSKHGTLVNGAPIAESELADDDVLSVGLTAFSVLIDVAEQDGLDKDLARQMDEVEQMEEFESASSAETR